MTQVGRAGASEGGHGSAYSSPVGSSISDGEAVALVALMRVRPQGMTWADITLQVLLAGSAQQVWEEKRPLTLIDDVLAQAARDVAEWRADGIAVTSILDEDYPRRLAGIRQTPPLIFSCGLLRSDDRAVAIVGSRKASEEGLRTARHVALGVAQSGISVLSGLAAGIDTAAHRAALDAGARTVAVIGTGVRQAYPATNRSLQDDIGRRGLVISQFWPDAPPTKQSFPMRNAVMSGYGLATVIVEAGEHSGARIQARVAVEHGRPVILLRQVATSNEWAGRLVGRAGVYVADGPAEVLDRIRSIEDEDRDISGLMTKLAGADSAGYSTDQPHAAH